MGRLLGLVGFRALSVAASITMLAGCSGDAAIAPSSAALQGGVQLPVGRRQVVLSAISLLDTNAGAGHYSKSFDACPAVGPIKYVSDDGNVIGSVGDIYVYSGKFAGQAPCGQITSGLDSPQSLFVDTTSHDLYVANTNGFDVLVFHRGQTTPYNVYTDPSVQYTLGVTVTRDGTVIASNIQAFVGGEAGSVSSWVGGPNGGKFIGNFRMTNAGSGGYVGANKDGTVYFNDVDFFTPSALWSMSCPAGECGTQTQLAGVSFKTPGDIAVDETGDLVTTDRQPGRVETFELPNPNPRIYAVGGFPTGIAINKLDHHFFVADPVNNYAAEYSYPGGKLIGTVPGILLGFPLGIAVDP